MRLACLLRCRKPGTISVVVPLCDSISTTCQKQSVLSRALNPRYAFPTNERKAVPRRYLKQKLSAFTLPMKRLGIYHVGAIFRAVVSYGILHYVCNYGSRTAAGTCYSLVRSFTCTVNSMLLVFSSRCHRGNGSSSKQKAIS